MGGLSPQEIMACREAFAKFDKDGSGSIDAAKLKAMFTSMGQTPTDEELFLMISQVDDDNSGARGGVRGAFIIPFFLVLDDRGLSRRGD